jgi:iron complex transport system ATP-binding protein
MMTATWSLERVSFRHENAARAAIDDVTVSIPGGRFTALLGPNGAGKSTFLQLLLRVLTPASGTITFHGRALSSASRKELARTIGVVPQGESEPLFSVREIVAMGRYPHLGAWQREGAADKTAVAEAMTRCDVAQFADRWFATLSGGERQRVRLARALAQRPSVLVLDEPTSSLDVRHEMTTFELLRELRDSGTTVLLATHNLNLAARYADEMILMHCGTVRAHGAARDVLTAELVAAVYEWPVTIVQHATGAPQVVPRGVHDDGAPHQATACAAGDR